MLHKCSITKLSYKNTFAQIRTFRYSIMGCFLSVGVSSSVVSSIMTFELKHNPYSEGKLKADLKFYSFWSWALDSTSGLTHLMLHVLMLCVYVKGHSTHYYWKEPTTNKKAEWRLTSFSIDIYRYTVMLQLYMN